MEKFDSMTHFIQSGGFEYRIFEMGRKVLPVSQELFQQIEDQQVLYPYPFQQKAWLAILIWQENKQAEAVIWFLQFPIDELGFLKQEARDAFLIELLEQAGKNIQAKQQGETILDELAESPFAFKPREDRLAMFHALASKALGQDASRYYQATREYLKGKLGYEQWQFLGLQGIADVVARLDQDNNQDLLISALDEMPDTPAENFVLLLENILIDEPLTASLVAKLNHQMAQVTPDMRLLSALVRGVSSAQPDAIRQEALLRVLSTAVSDDVEVLVAISGRAWLDLYDSSLLILFMEKLAMQNQMAFDAVLADLMMLPDMKEKVLAVMRREDRSSDLVERFSQFMQALQAE